MPTARHWRTYGTDPYPRPPRRIGLANTQFAEATSLLLTRQQNECIRIRIYPMRSTSVLYIIRQCDS